MSKEDLLEAKEEFIEQLRTTVTDVINREGGIKDCKELNAICALVKVNLFSIFHDATTPGNKKLVTSALNDNYGKPFCAASCLKVF